MLELYQLRYFLAVVETGNFTKAAEQCHVTQPTLSAGIKKLEGRLLKRLFNRTSRRVYLTEAGTQFVDRAKSILHACNEAEAAMREVPLDVALRIGLLRTVPAANLVPRFRKFRAAFPDVDIELFEGSEQELANRLDERSIDLAITILKPDAMPVAARELFEEGYSLALAQDHPLASSDRIDPQELANENIIVRTPCEVLSETSRHFTDHNVRPRIAYRTRHDERAIAMVAAGLGFTVMPDCYRQEGVVRVELRGFHFRRRIGIIAAPGGSLSELPEQTQSFLDLVEEGSS